MEVKTSGTRPGVEINGGISYLHTAFLKEDTIAVTQGANTAHPVPQTPLAGLASIVGANLYFDGGDRAIVRCSSFTEPLRLPLLPAGSSYEIYIDNNPLFEPDNAFPHGEMEEYYRVIKKVGRGDIPLEEQFELQFPNLDESSATGTGKFTISDERATIRIPCMSTTLDGQ